MPPGGDGVYYFSAHLTINQDDIGIFAMQLNGDVICSALGDQNTSGTGDSGATSCSAIAEAVAGTNSIHSAREDTVFGCICPFVYTGDSEGQE